MSAALGSIANLTRSEMKLLSVACALTRLPDPNQIMKHLTSFTALMALALNGCAQAGEQPLSPIAGHLIGIARAADGKPLTQPTNDVTLEG